MRKTLFLLTIALVACGGGGANPVVAAEADGVALRIHVDVNRPAYIDLETGECVIHMQEPTAPFELSPYVYRNERMPAFAHLGQQVQACLHGAVLPDAAWEADAPRFRSTVFYQWGDCTSFETCLGWADIPNSTITFDYVRLNAFPELLDGTYGHETWHIVAGYFHCSSKDPACPAPLESRAKDDADHIGRCAHRHD